MTIMIKRNWIFFLLLFLPLQYLGAENLTGYCFPPSVSLSKARNLLDAFLHPEDQIHPRPSKNCLEVKTNDKRSVLYETLLRKKLPLNEVYSDSKVVQQSTSFHNDVKETCKITTKEKTISQSKGSDLSLGRRNNFKNSEDNIENLTESQLLIDSGGYGHISVDNMRVRLNCQKAGSRFIIKVQLEHEKGGLSTTLTVSPGEEVNLGEVVKNLNNKGNTISLRDGYQKNKTKGRSKTTYTMVIN